MSDSRASRSSGFFGVPAIRNGLTFAALVLLTLCLDLWGIRWGLPSIQHFDSFHPDEWTVIEAAQRIAPLSGHLSPGFFNYGSCYIYALSAAFSFCQGIGILDAHPAPGSFDPTNKALLYLTARCVTAAFSLGTVLLTWRLGCRLFGKATGALAAVLLAISPIFAIYSHYAIVDVAAAFWMVLAALACARMLNRPAKPAAPTAAAGGGPARLHVAAPLIGGAIAAGLAAGTKYNAGVALLAVYLGWKWQLSDGRKNPAAAGIFAEPRSPVVEASDNDQKNSDERHEGKETAVQQADDAGLARLEPDGTEGGTERAGGGLDDSGNVAAPLASGTIPPDRQDGNHNGKRFHYWGDLVYGWLVLTLAAGGAFLVSTPGFLIDQGTFLKDFLFEVKHVRTGHGFIFSDTPPGFIHHIQFSLWIGVGPLLCLLFLAGALYAAVRRERPDMLMAAVVLPYYLVIGMAQVKFMRYTIPLLPFLAVWAARMVLAGFRRRTDSAPDPPSSTPSFPRPTFPLTLSRVACLAAVTLGALYALADTVAYDRILAAQPVQIQAENWIMDHVPAHATVGLIRPPWFDGPPLITYNDIRLQPEWVEAHENDLPYRLEIIDWDPLKLQRELPRYYVLTEWEVRYRLRLHLLEPNGSSETATAGRQAFEFMRVLGRHYRLTAAFSSPAALGPFRFSSVPPDPAGVTGGAENAAWKHWIPDDWLIPNPTIWVYERKDQRAAPPGT